MDFVLRALDQNLVYSWNHLLLPYRDIDEYDEYTETLLSHFAMRKTKKLFYSVQ